MDNLKLSSSKDYGYEQRKTWESTRKYVCTFVLVVPLLLLTGSMWTWVICQSKAASELRKLTDMRLNLLETTVEQLGEIRSAGRNSQYMNTVHGEPVEEQKSLTFLSNKRQRRSARMNDTSSSMSIHFEAYLPANLAERRIEPNERIYVDDLRGILTREGFQPSGHKYRFWKRSNEFLPVPEFIHLRGSHVTILRTGVYFVYAQVLYHDLSGRWAFGIFVDDEVKIQCTTSSLISADYISSLGEGDRSGHGVYIHCYTAGGIYIQENQRLSIRSMYDHRVVVLLNRSTFWGVIQLL